MQFTCPITIEELTPRPDTPPDRTALRSIPDLDDLSLGLGTKTSRSGINLRVVRSGGVSGLGVSSSRSRKFTGVYKGVPIHSEARDHLTKATKAVDATFLHFSGAAELSRDFFCTSARPIHSLYIAILPICTRLQGCLIGDDDRAVMRHGAFTSITTGSDDVE